MKKKFCKTILCALMTLSLAACGSAGGSSSSGASTGGNSAGNDKAVELNIAYQYGLAYAPLIIAKEQGLIEKAYQQKTGKNVTVNWNQMSSGADINTGIASGSIGVGFMGIAPAITGVMNNVGYKIFTNLSGQEHGLMTNDASIQSFDDLIGSNHQIALVNIGSIQHIILAKALDHAGYDAHALDSNLVVMKHPDGMTSLQTGSVPCHLTTNPYIYKEREDASLKEIAGISDVWTIENSFIVGVASKSLHDSDPELYDAICTAISEAIDYINQNMEDAAAITCEYNGNTKEDELKYMKVGKYTTETHGVFELAQFMANVSFIDEAPAGYSDLVFDNVKGD